MSIRFYADENVAAIYEEAPGGGDPIDPSSLMNRPIVAPLSWLPNIYFHSELDYYGVVASTLSTPITHPVIPGITRTAGGTGEVSTVVSLAGQTIESDHLLLQHNLGYVPKFFGIQNGKLVPNSFPVQYVSTNRVRFASIYATSAQIRVRTLGWSDANSTPAATINYGALVFRDAAPISGEAMLDLYPGNAVFGQGKFKGSNPHLRVVGPGDTLFAAAMDRTAAVRNGGLRSYAPDGGFFDYGVFNGTLAPPEYIYVTAGV